MRDYTELIAALRYCTTSEGCLKCHRRNFLDDCSSIAINEAADAIEELLAELVAIRNQLPHSISEEERLPERHQRVIVAFDNGSVSMSRLFGGKFPAMVEPIDVDSTEIIEHPVTHWMPLPEPPEGVE